MTVKCCNTLFDDAADMYRNFNDIFVLNVVRGFVNSDHPFISRTNRRKISVFFLSKFLVCSRSI
jgi:hypothetical protein